MNRRNVLLLGIVSANKLSEAQQITVKSPLAIKAKRYRYPSFALDREVVVFNTRQGRFEKFTVGRVKLKFIVDHWQAAGKAS